MNAIINAISNTKAVTKTAKANAPKNKATLNAVLATVLSVTTLSVTALSVTALSITTMTAIMALSPSVLANENTKASQSHSGHEHAEQASSLIAATKARYEDQHGHEAGEKVHDNVASAENADVHDDNEHDSSETSGASSGESSTGGEKAEHQAGISFSAEKMALAGIRVASIQAQIFANNLYAPGEIKANGYKSYIVSPRTESVIVSRHATLGQHVEKGHALVTLFSESVAQAQANYRVAYNDWQRNKKLGKETVSESRLLTSQTDYIAAFSRLRAFGLTESAIAQVVKDNSSNLGEYTLIAQRAGAVLSDDFSQGQRVSAGDAIMVLADESELWVEARVSPNKQLNLPIGTQAVVDMADESFIATVIQEAHTIDPKTRTRIVRLAVKNIGDRLHPGMFVDVNFRFETESKVIAVPESALMRSSDGDWTVFVEDHPGEFAAVEVELGRSLGAFREISGIAEQTRIVTKGAFFVASEIAKGGFDPHGH